MENIVAYFKYIESYHQTDIFINGLVSLRTFRPALLLGVLPASLRYRKISRSNTLDKILNWAIFFPGMHKANHPFQPCLTDRNHRNLCLFCGCTKRNLMCVSQGGLLKFGIYHDTDEIEPIFGLFKMPFELYRTLKGSAFNKKYC